MSSASPTRLNDRTQASHRRMSMAGTPDSIDFPAPPEEFLTYKNNRIISIIDDPGSVQSAIDELVQAGVPEEDIYVLSGPEGAARLDLSGKHHGLRGRIYRFLEHLGDERQWLEHHGALIERGAFGVSLPADDESKASAAEILARHGGRDTAYFGKWHWETM
jgi:hypothetical protein